MRWYPIVDYNGRVRAIKNEKNQRIVRWDGVTDLRTDWGQKNVTLILRAPDLLDELEDRYIQTRCGCGHPACNRCADDFRVEQLLGEIIGGNYGQSGVSANEQ